VVGPAFSGDAAQILRRKQRLRVVEMAEPAMPPSWAPRAIAGGMIVQTPDNPSQEEGSWKVATRRAPSSAEMAGLRLAWLVAAYVRSNAIVLVRAQDQGWRTTGVGPGQTSRVESVRAALRRAGEAASGSVLGSDGFFPQGDGVRVAATAGVTALVQPGGSKKDAEVVAAADELGLAMVLTGIRHFRH
jgi:phosphoribosylaminoimidazolecarboxamide formyltransferase/IMP cyclohydrolase